MEWLVRPARSADLDAVEELLRASALPLDGVRAHFDTFIVAEAQARLVGSAGFEIYDSCALLRSVVVHESARGSGLGSSLVVAGLERALERAIMDVYLLTTTAAGFFSKHGFERIDRAQVPASIGGSVEFTTACPASATAMRWRIAAVSGSTSRP
jgi:amino-acid N-acetyltransferase